MPELLWVVVLVVEVVLAVVVTEVVLVVGGGFGLLWLGCDVVAVNPADVGGADIVVESSPPPQPISAAPAASASAAGTAASFRITSPRRAPAGAGRSRDSR